jgi:hypothetical protein
MNHPVKHPMVKFQRQVQSLVDSKAVRPSDSIWKIALLFGSDWARIKQDLLEFGFTMQDPLSELLLVEGWDED